MSRRTRVFLAVAGAILAIGLGVGFVASLLGGTLTFGDGDAPAEFAYVPVDTRFIAYADVRGIMDSELRRRLSGPATGSGDATRRFRDETGIDLEQDIDHVIAAWSGQDVSDPPIVLMRGTLDQDRIEALVRSQGGVVEEYGGRTLVRHGERLAVAFVEPGLVAVGSLDALRRAIDVGTGSADARDNDELMSLVRQVRGGHVWLVARFDELTEGRIPPDLAGQLPAITWISLTGFVDAGVQGRLSVEARDEMAAQDLREVIRGFLALARMNAGDRAVVGDLIDSLQLTGQGTTVALSFAIPPEVIDLLGAIRDLQPDSFDSFDPPFPGL